jgi:predicted GNAT family acetyltransferase
MRICSFDDPAAFREAADPLLSAEPALNNLTLGILSTLIGHPETYPVFHLWLAEMAGDPVGACLRTDPYKVVLAEPAEPEAIDALCDVVVAALPDAPGVVANLPWSDRFVERWCGTTGDRAWKVLAQGVYALTSVRDPRPAFGSHRPCWAADRDLVRSWIRDFHTEALAHEPYDPRRTERVLDVRLADADDQGMWFWEVDGEPVSLVGFGRAGEGGTRIGPVFTPRRFRGRGYASNLVAELSRWALSSGTPACFLYTDLGNATSNGIYVALGYEQVAESAEYAFVR